MNLYEIDKSIESLIDENGEVLDFDAFMALQMERVTKVENTALWLKNTIAAINAIKAEETALAERRKPMENQADKMKSYIAEILNGEKFNTARVAISYRASTAVDIADEETFINTMKASGNMQYLTLKDPTINKTAVKEAIKLGTFVPGASLIERQNIQIK